MANNLAARTAEHTQEFDVANVGLWHPPADLGSGSDGWLLGVRRKLDARFPKAEFWSSTVSLVFHRFNGRFEKGPADCLSKCRIRELAPPAEPPDGSCQRERRSVFWIGNSCSYRIRISKLSRDAKFADKLKDQVYMSTRLPVVFNNRQCVVLNEFR